MNENYIDIQNSEDIYYVGYNILTMGIVRASEKYNVSIQHLKDFCVVYKIPFEDKVDLGKWIANNTPL
jgi:hypothetical protein